MKYQLAIFDFDGTLADSFPFFIQVFNQLAKQYNFKNIPPDLAPNYRHYTPRQMMQEVGLPTWKLPFVARSFKSLMQKNQNSISLFEHMDDVLNHLKHNGVTLAIVSSNAHDNINQIMGAENTKHFSHFECGVSMFGKASRIRKTLRKTGIPAHQAIYIGDQIPDLEAARKEKVAFGAVAWGYATIEALRAHLPEEEFKSVLDIKNIA
jgi:phosphoglycolate phosphatase